LFLFVFKFVIFVFCPDSRSQWPQARQAAGHSAVATHIQSIVAMLTQKVTELRAQKSEIYYQAGPVMLDKKKIDEESVALDIRRRACKQALARLGTNLSDSSYLESSRPPDPLLWDICARARD